MVRRALPFLLALFLGASPLLAAPQPRVHVVAEGQRLGSIAKRYNVSIAAVCAANGIDRRDPIRPGQRLVIPKKGQAAEGQAAEPSSPPPGSLPRVDPEPNLVVHQVASGQRLESIARRYRTTVDAICKENQIDRRSVLRVGQKLRIPGTQAPSAPTARSAKPEKSSPYARRPQKKGYVELVGHKRTFRGYVLDKHGKLLPKARQEIGGLLGVRRGGPPLDEHLVRRLVQVSDHFGGRPLRVVSGYRSSSYFKDSRHKASRAVDFSVTGVPNDVLRDYLRTFSRAGVGYYPNSSFVHFDVREYSAYWVDYSRPGEAPRRSPAHRVLAKTTELEDENETSTGAVNRAAATVPAMAVAGAVPLPPTEVLSVRATAAARPAESPRANEYSQTLPVRALRPAPARARLRAPDAL